MNTPLRDCTLHQLLAAYSAPTIVPAGISGCALSGAIGAALILKVAILSARKLPEGHAREKVLAIARRVEPLRNMLEDIVDQDAKACARLAKTKSGHGKGVESDDTLQRALKTATIVPGAMGRASMICLNLATDLVEFAHPPALPDLAMGAWLCRAAAESSLLAMQHNLQEITDKAFCDKITAQMSFFDGRQASLERILLAVDSTRYTQH